MESILEFFANNVYWLAGLTTILIFALIGYFVDNDYRGKKILKTVVVNKPTSTNQIEEIKNNFSENKNVSLNEIINENKNKQEQTQPVNSEQNDQIVFDQPLMSEQPKTDAFEIK